MCDYLRVCGNTHSIRTLPLPSTNCHLRGRGWAEHAGEVCSPQPMPQLHTGGHRDSRPFWARDFLVLERTGLPSQTGYRGSQVVLLPSGTPVRRSATGKCRCSDGNNGGTTSSFNFLSWLPFIFWRVYGGEGGTECLPFNWLPVFHCVHYHISFKITPKMYLIYII